MYSILSLFLVAAVSTVLASPHPKAVMDLSVYDQSDYGNPYALANAEEASSDLDMQGEILESKCAPDGIQSVGKVRRMVPCDEMDASSHFQDGHNNGKTTPPKAQDEGKPETAPETPKPAPQKNDSPDPNATPELGPLYRPQNGWEDQGPCKWPLRFLCCSGKLLIPYGNVDGCWLCTCFLPSSSTLSIPQR